MTSLLSKPSVSVTIQPAPITVPQRKQNSTVRQVPGSEHVSKVKIATSGNNPTSVVFSHPSHYTPHFHFTTSITNGTMRWNPSSDQLSSPAEFFKDSDQQIPLPYREDEAQVQAARTTDHHLYQDMPFVISIGYLSSESIVASVYVLVHHQPRTIMSFAGCHKNHLFYCTQRVWSKELERERPLKLESRCALGI